MLLVSCLPHQRSNSRPNADPPPKDAVLTRRHFLYALLVVAREMFIEFDDDGGMLDIMEHAKANTKLKSISG